MKYYERKLLDYKDRMRSYNSVLTKLCEITSINDYTLLPALISRKLSKIHYSKYLENTKLYQKLRTQFKDLSYYTQRVFDRYSSDQSQNFENLKKLISKMTSTFNLNSERSFMTESNIDENSSDVGKWEGSSSRSNDTNEMLEDFKVDKANDATLDGSGVREVLDAARFTNELNLMAIEEFNNISNNLEIIRLDDGDSDANDEEDDVGDSYDENYDILEDIDGKIKMLENWFEQ